MFQFALEAALLTFRQRAPHLDPLLQLPPTIATETGEGRGDPKDAKRIPSFFILWAPGINPRAPLSGG